LNLSCVFSKYIYSKPYDHATLPHAVEKNENDVNFASQQQNRRQMKQTRKEKQNQRLQRDQKTIEFLHNNCWKLKTTSEPNMAFHL